MKVALCEIKKNLQGTTVMRRKPGLKSMVWSKRKKETFTQNRIKKQEFKKKKETRIQKKEERLRNLQDNFKQSNI